MNLQVTRHKSFALACSCLLTVVLAGAASVGHAQSAQGVNGVSNFGHVSDVLFRGAQPSSMGFNALKAMGVGIVVNFRDDGETTSEQREVESLGMKYVSIPWSGHDYPSNAQVAQFLDLVRSNPRTKVFVHCRAGADRTGTMIAAYRIAMEHESVAEALKEMHAFHYHHFFLPQLERYVDSFPQALVADALFSAYTPPVKVAARMVATTVVAPPIAVHAVAVPVVQ